MASGLHVVTAGEKPPATTWNDFITKQVVQIYATATDRNTQTSGQKREGMLFYRADGRVLELSRSAVSGEVSTMGPAHGAWFTWTPTLTQSGAVTKTVTRGFYCRWGRLIIADCVLSCTGSGTGSNSVQISLPVTAAYSSSLPVGTGFIIDTSASSTYQGNALLGSSTVAIITAPGVSLTFASTIMGSGANTFTAALASGDTVALQVTYEAAADA